MKKCLLLSLFAIISMSRPAWAQTSEATRKTKTFMIEAHLGFNGAGAGLGLFLPNDNRLDLSLSRDDIFQFAAKAKFKRSIEAS